MSVQRALRPARIFACLALLCGGLGLAGGCSDSTPAQPAASCPSADGGGPAPGVADIHCTDTAGAKIVQHIGMCVIGLLPDAGVDAGSSSTEPFEVRYGTSASDDDCKYDASYTLDCASHGYPVTLTLTLNNRETGAPADGAAPYAEVYLSDTHLSPSHPVVTALGAGKYSISGVSFDQAGRWTIRFHFFETCNDTPDDSPHGHVAFYVDVL